MIPKHVRKKLPKARRLKVQLNNGKYFARFRGANFTRWQIGSVCVTHRSPWLAGPARQLHPHLWAPESKP